MTLRDWYEILQTISVKLMILSYVSFGFFALCYARRSKLTDIWFTITWSVLLLNGILFYLWNYLFSCLLRQP